MKVAITGGTGFLGKYVSELLEENNVKVVKFSRKESNDAIQTDYSYKDLIEKLKGIDAVVHLAAKRGSQGLISEFHDNEIMTQNLYEACHELKIKNIIFASTISVYSDDRRVPWDETEVPSPELMYGVSKLTCEQIGNIYNNKFGMNIKNYRLAHIFGFNEKNNYMINKFIRQGYLGKNIILNSQSYAKREFLYARDAAEAIYLGIQAENLKGTFNIGSEEALTNYEVAKTINKVFSPSKKLVTVIDNSPENIHGSLMKSSRSRELLGNYSNHTFEEALIEISSLMEDLENVPELY
ncbi:NAD-dependent epimerase/dehydratase family protein [Vagococcus fessus]|uniref:UDP-N-acetylglucosamine 4-epimerase n=1 Tax=Vagococcus fessus TaxID=120370 RepID=A0A430A985_9ENTE|nr:SDR family oxidoreductase [Vagococcus fessus]RSU03712.1 UDP-N-acetylglucosamine 4-epimerase [Vagococcus fessus]